MVPILFPSLKVEAYPRGGMYRLSLSTGDLSLPTGDLSPPPYFGLVMLRSVRNEINEMSMDVTVNSLSFWHIARFSSVNTLCTSLHLGTWRYLQDAQ